MEEKKSTYFSFFVPSTGYYFTDDPAIVGRGRGTTYNAPWDDLPYKLSDKPLIVQPPRPRAKPPEASEPKPDADAKPPEFRPDPQ